MYQTKNIHYKAIFKQDGQSETIEYKAKGILHNGEKTLVSFETEAGKIDMSYDENGVSLSHGDSLLYFDFHKDHWNQYKLPYGSVPLKTRLLKFEANEERIKMKYELHDQRGLISTVYILMTMIPDSFQEGA
ncbi:MAG: DUF1934 family protein [Coprobacillus cateniformis]|uniref:Uncharacterized beta-barrel protein YwiB (DUF1934 family) n=1 Tax=Longibaculum muris TaxID=1796628 RepID=A0A4R3YU09_9FIRM|nr:DUF1934 family protein [Longibaculum muris]KXU47446.1 hypothetical protein HMPREF3037_01886 [Candidatus Stoquefichus sp. KLE1796]MBS5112090.1 DUF1934 family protein [Coprobacillus cateniformis]MBS5367993.1 DUF1934 family protein [Coprobacillus cateniformis]MCR1888219.1 DUF1934 family protein [Longibaculum muris]MED9810497.1 DUF1934 family protein [Longibaculum muris]